MRDRAHEVVSQNRAAASAPSSSKNPPTFNATQVAALCDVDRNRLEVRRKKGGLPDGIDTGSRRRSFTLEETRQWVMEFRKARHRLSVPGAEAGIITIGNFKGGVGKSTTAATLAQGLSLRGHKVLVIDTDPQGSLTSLMGVDPESLDDAETVLSVTSGSVDSLAGSIKPTYWSGIDLIGAAPRISSSQFYLPARTRSDGYEFWTAISAGLTPELRSLYDVIIIDTPPAMDYLTINAFFAADILIIPLPPSAMDFVSSTQFWELFVGLSEEFEEYGMKKEYSFVNVLLSRVDSNDSASALVREWITEAYGKHLLPVEIPTTAAAKNAAAEFGTVYDSTIAQESVRTYRRAYEAYERCVEIMEDQLKRVWQSKVNPVGV